MKPYPKLMKSSETGCARHAVVVEVGHIEQMSQTQAMPTCEQKSPMCTYVKVLQQETTVDPLEVVAYADEVPFSYDITLT